LYPLNKLFYNLRGTVCYVRFYFYIMINIVKPFFSGNCFWNSFISIFFTIQLLPLKVAPLYIVPVNERYFLYPRSRKGLGVPCSKSACSYNQNMLFLNL